MSFETIDASVPTTASKIVDSADFDRTLTIRAGNIIDSTAVNVYVGYSSTDCNFRLPETDTEAVRAVTPAVNLVLPAGYELWAKSTATPASIWVFVGGAP